MASVELTGLLEEICEHTESEVEPTVEKLLVEWNFSGLIEGFQHKGIDIEVLKELTSEDLNRLIPDESFGLRIKFRKQFYRWQKEQGCRSTAVTTTVDTWLSSLPISIVSESPELLSKNQCSVEQSSPQPCSSSTCQTENNSGATFDLEKELNKTTGAFILSNYKRNKQLTRSDRQVIVQVAAEHLISKNRRITNSEYKEVSQQIVQLFPTEDEATYFGTKTQRGKLAEKYYTLSKKFVKAGIIERPRKRKTIAETTVPHKQLITNIEDQQNNYLWLQKNFSPEIFVTEKWINSYELRRRHIQDLTTDILEQWPILKQKIGISLIEIDFEKLFPQKSTLLFSKWDCFYQKIIKIYDRDLKDSYCRRFLDSLKSITNADSKNYITTILLNGILIPQVINGKGLKKSWKPSIKDAQNSFATHLVDKSYIQSTIELRKAQCNQQNLHLQPSIIVIGDTPENLRQFYIYFNDILYEIDNFLKAMSINFQLHYVLGLKYAVECGQVWQLIEEYFYEMDTTKNKNSTLNALLKELKNQITD